MPPPIDRRSFIRSASVAALAVAGAGRLSGATLPARPIRVAQIGTDHSHAGAKWRTLQDLPEFFDPVGIFEPVQVNREGAMEDGDFEGARWLSEEELFTGGGVDAVLIETDLPGLVHWADRALAQGWHVHIDKPPGRDLAGLAGLQEKALEMHRTLQMGYMFRYHPAFTFCLQAVRSGWLGKIHAIHGDIGKAIGAERRPGLAESYGGSMMLLGCHLLDLAVAILGRPENVRFFRRNSHPEHDAFMDNETAVLEYSDAVATIRSLLFEVGGGDRRQFVVLGEKGTVEIRPLEPARLRLVLAEPAGAYPAGEHAVPIASVNGRYRTQLEDFARMARGAPTILTGFSPQHDRLVQEVLAQASGLPFR
ncbi:MAG: Gfo/Idh/MocA family oxidoreductase [Opitutaceae bacterium]